VSENHGHRRVFGAVEEERGQVSTCHFARGAILAFPFGCQAARSFDSEFEATPRMIGRRDRVYQEKVNGGGPLLALSTRAGSLRITGR